MRLVVLPTPKVVKDIKRVERLLFFNQQHYSEIVSSLYNNKEKTVWVVLRATGTMTAELFHYK